MKSISFTGKLPKNSRSLHVHSSAKTVAIKEDYNVKITDENFGIEKITFKERWFPFELDLSYEGDLMLVVKNTKQYDIIDNDYVELVLPEYQISGDYEIIEGGKGYSLNDVMVYEGHEGKVFIKPKKLSEEGGVEELELIEEKNFLTSSNIECYIEGGSGNGLEINIFLEDSYQKRHSEAQVKEVSYEEGNSYLILIYDLPNDLIKKGQIKLRRTLITLDRPSTRKDYLFVNCVAEKHHYTPKYQIPIVEPGTVNAPILYSKGAIIMENKLEELEKRIANLEKRSLPF